LYDDRDLGAGEKLGDADLIGCPIRLVISNKTLKEDSVEMKKRNEKGFELIKFSQIINKIC
jgi:prolyl-tRNA synthetase